MIQSPCKSQCSVSSVTKLCKGCKRKIEEIANWSKYTDEERKKIIEELKTR